MVHGLGATSKIDALSQHRIKPTMDDMVWIPGGTFLMGSDKHYAEEARAHQVTVDGFWMDSHTVTNEEFCRFVEATKHVTVAERPPNPRRVPPTPPVDPGPRV